MTVDGRRQMWREKEEKLEEEGKGEEEKAEAEKGQSQQRTTKEDQPNGKRRERRGKKDGSEEGEE